MAVANSQRRGRTIPGLMNLSSYPYASDKRRCLPFQPKVSALSARHSRLANASVDLSCDAANRHAIGIGAGAALEPAGTAIRCQGGPAVLREGCGWGEVLRHAGGEPIGRVCRPVRNVFRPAAADDAGPVGLTSSYAICSYGADRVEHLRAELDRRPSGGAVGRCVGMREFPIAPCPTRWEDGRSGARRRRPHQSRFKRGGEGREHPRERPGGYGGGREHPRRRPDRSFATQSPCNALCEPLRCGVL